MSTQVLIVIDLQNDYFADGNFPLWNADVVLSNIEGVIANAHEKHIPIILIQHIADAMTGKAPFFNEGTKGAEIHPRILAAAPDGIIVNKAFADGFYRTTLEETLSTLGADELVICGMMTQNCVTHTAISKAAEKYSVKVLSDCCTSVSQMIHLIALKALFPRVPVVESESVFCSDPMTRHCG